jgi:hypothetical protein
MSKRKLSKADYSALNKGRTVVTSYPKGGYRAQLRMSKGPRAQKGRRQ